MQKFLTFTLACLVVILAALCFWQSSEVSTQKGKVALLQAELNKATEHTTTQQRRIESLEQDKTDFAAPSSKSPSTTVRKDASAKSDSDSEKGGFGSMMSKMLKDPEMKKALAAQQGAMIKKMYGPLAKELKFTPEETEKFNTLLGEHQLAQMDAGTSLMSGEGDKAEATKKVQDTAADFEKQMKDFLGDDHYGQYTNYQQSLGDRMALDQFKGQLDDHPLTEDQTHQLLDLMVAERKKAGANIPNEADGMKLLDNDEAMAKLMTQANIASQEVLRKADFLTPEQRTSLGEFQTNQMAMQKAGLEMARKFMGKKSNAASAIPGAPASQ